MRLFTMLFLASAVSAAEPIAHTDVVYATNGDAKLTFDAKIPAGDGPFPACVLVHGGGFTKGTKNSYITPIFEPLVQAGFAYFTIDYRLAPAARWPAQAEDVAAAVKFVKAHAKDYHIDPAKIFIIGESAGGHLVSDAGTRDLGIAGVVAFYAPHDLELQVSNRKALGNSMTALLNLTELNDAALKTLREASPSSRVRAKLPPYLLIHGDKDEQVPFEQSVRFQKAMQAVGNSCELVTIPGGKHGMGGWDKLAFDYKTPMLAWLTKQAK